MIEWKVGQITKHREDSSNQQVSADVLGQSQRPLDMAVIFFIRIIFQQSPRENHPKFLLLCQ